MMTEGGLQAEQQPQTLARVVAFVLRERGEDRELLVVRHLTAPARLPVTTVGLDESEDAAALRVARDWTGSDVVALRRRLAVVRQTMPPGEWLVVHPSLLRTAPNPDATAMRFTLERGMPVRVTESRGDDVRVVYEESAMEDDELVISTRRAGWASAAVLASQVDYHLYELRALVPAKRPSMNAFLNPVLGTPRPLAEGAAVWVSLSNSDSLVRAVGLDQQHEQWLNQVLPYLNGTEA